METIFSLYNVTYNVFFRELVNRLCPGIYIFFVIVFPLFHCFRHFNGKLHTDDVNIAIFFISVSKSTRTYIFFISSNFDFNGFSVVFRRPFRIEDINRKRWFAIPFKAMSWRRKGLNLKKIAQSFKDWECRIWKSWCICLIFQFYYSEVSSKSNQ